jgi:hypothetical protein
MAARSSQPRPELRRDELIDDLCRRALPHQLRGNQVAAQAIEQRRNRAPGEPRKVVRGQDPFLFQGTQQALVPLLRAAVEQQLGIVPRQFADVLVPQPQREGIELALHEPGRQRRVVRPVAHPCADLLDEALEHVDERLRQSFRAHPVLPFGIRGLAVDPQIEQLREER